MYEDEINHVTLADPDMVRYLLALLPPDAVAELDTSRLRRLQTKQVGRGARKRVADMAWAVGAPTREHPDAEVLLVIEFQAAPHPRMALRMDAYVALLRLEMADALPDAVMLPPVLPLLVYYTGDRPWSMPALRQLTAPAGGLQRWQPELEMLPLDATTLSADDGKVNPAAALLRLQRCRQAAELADLTAPIAALFRALEREGRRAFWERLSDALAQMLAVRFGGRKDIEELRRALRNMEDPTMLAERVSRWYEEALDKGRRQGVSEGMSEGRRQGVSEGMSEGRRQGVSEGRRLGMSEGERTLLRRLAAGRFGVATGNALATLLASEEDVERLAKVGDLVVACTSAEELLRRSRGLLNGGS